jgi:hypothetical protein
MDFEGLNYLDMKSKMLKQKAFASCIIILLCTIFSIAQDRPEINVVYGEKHIFTIETPKNWINDRELAQQIGLVCFFYATGEKNRNLNYFYANGIDKETPKDKLDDFIKSDLETYKKKYPKLTFSVVPVEFTGGVRNGKFYSFSNLTDRYKEEVLYSETDDSFIIIAFSSLTKEEYEKNQPIFDKFVESFNYRGNNPKPFLDYMKKNK